jgi:hypothetical protein
MHEVSASHWKPRGDCFAAKLPRILLAKKAEGAAYALLHECCREAMEYAHQAWFKKFGWGDSYTQVTQ